MTEGAGETIFKREDDRYYREWKGDIFIRTDPAYHAGTSLGTSTTKSMWRVMALYVGILSVLGIMAAVSGCQTQAPALVEADTSVNEEPIRLVLDRYYHEASGRCFSGTIELTDLQAVIPLVTTRIYPQTCKPEQNAAGAQ